MDSELSSEISKQIKSRLASQFGFNVDKFHVTGGSLKSRTFTVNLIACKEAVLLEDKISVAIEGFKAGLSSSCIADIEIELMIDRNVRMPKTDSYLNRWLKKSNNTI